MGGNRVTIGKDECHDVTIDNDECRDETIDRDITDGRWNTYVCGNWNFISLYSYVSNVHYYCNSFILRLSGNEP